ncbi:hypothetical protein PV328_004297 [Microctonus aethiopoides]|uniref:Uncharacterized protein n=1 Tax=Microctonus aethiopoides TaxID=144406 RepID=A0AA39FAF4_9HYME|nr:hypothetical protein PV328_004297 [Microctonus aethiopoides]
MMCIIKKTLIFLGIFIIIGDNVITSVIAASLNDSQQLEDNQPIICVLDFNKFAQLSGDPQVKEFQSNASEYLLDFKKYAKSFKNFVSKYPYVTIAANGLAISNSTFGDVGKGKFDLLHFATNNFMRRRSEYLVDIVNASDEKLNAYKVSVRIGIGFSRKNSRLYLTLYLGGGLENFDQQRRYLQFAFVVESITFNPKD